MAGDLEAAEPEWGPLDTLDYEAAISELDSVLARLEDGKVPLEEAMRLYERGVGLVGRCSALLDGAERRVTELASGPGGSVQETDFSLPGETEETGADGS